MLEKTAKFASAGDQDATKRNVTAYSTGMLKGTVAYAEDVNTFINMLDSDVYSTSAEICNLIRALNPSVVFSEANNTQLKDALYQNIGDPFIPTGVVCDGASVIPTATQSGNTITFNAFSVVFNLKGYYGSNKNDYQTVSFQRTQKSASSSYATGVWYFYATKTGTIELTQTPVDASDGATKCALGSVYVLNGAFQSGSFKYQPWLRITSIDLRETPYSEINGGYIDSASATTLQMGALQINSEAINFSTTNGYKNPNVLKVNAVSPFSYKFLYPGYNASASAVTTLDTHKIYNLTSGTFDTLSSSYDGKFMVMVPCIAPTGQTLMIPAMSTKSGTTYPALFNDMETARRSVFGLQYTSNDKTRSRVIYLGQSIVVKVGATDLTDKDQFQVVPTVPQALAGFSPAGGQASGGGAVVPTYIPMPRVTKSGSSVTLQNNASNIVTGSSSYTLNMTMPTPDTTIINQLQVEYVHQSGFNTPTFSYNGSPIGWWYDEAPIFNPGTYVIIIEYVNGQWIGGYKSK